MQGLNEATLIGNLGMDSELKFTSGGQAVLRLRVATTESFKDKNGERKERTDWHTCVLWGKRAEALAKYTTKGTQVWVKGSIQTRSWEDKDGSKRYATEINVRDIGLLGSKNGGGGNRQQDSVPVGDDYDHGPGATADDDIPFAPMPDIG